MASRSVAVVVERAYKHYGSPDKPDYKVVLSNLDMTVEKGIIYGLLGPSGCGKTTLLSCIVGRKQLNAGEVYVLGGKPGEKGSGVPGPRVGYMPQEIALVPEFTVRDAIYYFGRIYGMKMPRLSERYDFLSSLLELPNGNRLIKSLSGGQQRRVSLAAALVHNPELLILDEPTVGLDPILREQIWEYLAELARGGTTVIITTHYIDETKQANKIGLLRDGQLLAEDSPEEILRKFDCNNLEDAFLKLALRQHEMPRRRSTLTGSPDVIPESRVSAVESRYQSSEDFNVVTSSTDVLTKKTSSTDKKDKKNLSKARYNAVFIKNLQQFIRHPGGLIFSVLFPIIEVVAFFMAVGHDPRGLKLGIVNEEAASSPYGIDICNNHSLKAVTLLDDDTCQSYMLSCWFQEALRNNDLELVMFNNSEEAQYAVSHAILYGALYFPTNFSEALTTRVREGYAEDDVLDASTITAWLDMTNHQVSYYLKSKIYKTYESFTRRVMRECDRNENLVQIPVHFGDPVYGSKDSEMVAFMAPGILVTIIFFMAAIVTSNLMISDRLEGTWERSAVAGVKAKEMLYVHIVLQTAIIIFQTFEMMALAYGGYGLPNKGSYIICGLLLFLQGVSGMSYGFFLSVFCSSYTVSFFVATGSFYPMILLCGILWPLEGMSKVVRIIATALPFTIPSSGLRDVMEKGYGITEPSVYCGFLVTLVWIMVTLVSCLLRLKYKKA